MSFGLLVLELLHRGYRVIVSTHSPILLDMVWAVKSLHELPEKTAVNALKRIFGLASLSANVREILVSSLQKRYRTYVFEQTQAGVETTDISTLDPGDDNPKVSGWGGLSGFSGTTAEAVGDALSGQSK